MYFFEISVISGRVARNYPVVAQCGGTRGRSRGWGLGPLVSIPLAVPAGIDRGSAPIMGCAASTSIRISTSLSSDTIGAFTGTSRSKPCSGSPRTITRRVTGISSGATIPQRRADSPARAATPAGQRPACGQTDQDLPKKSNPALFRFDPPALDIDQSGTTGCRRGRRPRPRA